MPPGRASSRSSSRRIPASCPQARAIAADYNIRGGSTSLPVRRALLFYALKRLGLDVPQNARPPHEQHIVLLNRKDVEAALVRRPEA